MKAAFFIFVTALGVGAFADEAQMRAAKWMSPCELASVHGAGVQSSHVVFDFNNGPAKIIEYFADQTCQDMLASVAYDGTVDVGASTADDVRLLDLNFLRVSVTVVNQSLVDTLNSSFGGVCGINDWKVNESRDVSASAGFATCPVAKPSQKFDIVRTDGQTLMFGLIDGAHDGLTPAGRPVVLDSSRPFTKK